MSDLEELLAEAREADGEGEPTFGVWPMIRELFGLEVKTATAVPDNGGDRGWIEIITTGGLKLGCRWEPTDGDGPLIQGLRFYALCPRCGQRDCAGPQEPVTTRAELAAVLLAMDKKHGRFL